MKVKDLRKILETANPEAEVVVPSEDHSYRRGWGSVTVIREVGGDYYEDWEGKLAKGEKRVEAVVIN